VLISDVRVQRVDLVELAFRAVALQLPHVGRVELDDPVHRVVRAGGTNRFDEPALLVGEEIATVEHVRVPQHVREQDGRLLCGVEAELREHLVARNAPRPFLHPARQCGGSVVTARELLLEASVFPLAPGHSLDPLPRLVGERPGMHATRLVRVPLEHQCVVLRRADHLHDVEPARECDVGERPLVGVVSLDEHQE
jgi:hypothetical protein